MPEPKVYTQFVLNVIDYVEPVEDEEGRFLITLVPTWGGAGGGEPRQWVEQNMVSALIREFAPPQ